MLETKTWKERDLHKFAYQSLTNDRGKNIAKRLGKNVLDADTGCIQCHSVSASLPAEYDRENRQEWLQYGIDCEACHGPSKTWFESHSLHQLNKYPNLHYEDGNAKASIGWIDIRWPVTRAELCISCHQGSSEHKRVITHDMYAAGHPPLVGYELETFSDKMPRHWRTAREKSKDGAPSYERTRNMLVAAVVAMRMSVELAIADSKKGDWPQLARLDCFACHHDLQAPDVRSVQPGSPGRPPLMMGCLPLVRAAAEVADKSSVGQLHILVGRLQKSFKETPFGKPKEIESCGKDIIAWCRSIEDRLASMELTSQDARQVLPQLTTKAAGEGPDDSVTRQIDYDTARQIMDAWMVCYWDLVADKKSEWLTNVRPAIEDKFAMINKRRPGFIEPKEYKLECGGKLPDQRVFDEMLRFQFDNRIGFKPQGFESFMSELAKQIPE